MNSITSYILIDKQNDNIPVLSNNNMKAFIKDVLEELFNNGCVFVGNSLKNRLEHEGWDFKIVKETIDNHNIGYFVKTGTLVY